MFHVALSFFNMFDCLYIFFFKFFSLIWIQMLSTQVHVSLGRPLLGYGSIKVGSFVLKLWIVLCFNILAQGRVVAIRKHALMDCKPMKFSIVHNLFVLGNLPINWVNFLLSINFGYVSLLWNTCVWERRWEERVKWESEYFRSYMTFLILFIYLCFIVWYCHLRKSP